MRISSASYRNTESTKPKVSPVSNAGIINNNKNKTSKIAEYNINDMEQMIIKKEKKLEEVKKKLKEENVIIGNILAKKDSIEKEIEFFNNILSLNNFKEQLVKINKKYEEKKIKYDKTLADKNKTEREIKELKNTMQSKGQHSSSSTNKRIQNLEKNFVEENKIFNEAKVKYAQYLESKTKLETEIKDLEKKIQTKKGQTSITIKNNNIEKKIKELRKQVGREDSKYIEEKKKYAPILDNKNNLEREIQELKNKIKLQIRNANANINKNDVQIMYKESDKILIDKDMILKDEKEKYDEIIESKKKMEIEIQGLKNKMNLESEKYNVLVSKINKYKEENNLLNKEKNYFETKYNEELLNNNAMKEDNQSLKDKLSDINKKYKELLSNFKNNPLSNDIKKDNSLEIKQAHNEYNYDVGIRIESLNQLLKGWDIKYGKNDKTKYISMKNKQLLLIGLLGFKNSGKSFFISKLLDENTYEKEEKDYLYIKYIQQKNVEFTIIDTPGLGRSLKNNEGFDYSNEDQIKELEKYNIQTDNFLINFILKKCNFIICVVGFLNYNEQKLLKKLKMKDEEYKKEYNKIKKIFIIHNLKELSTINEVSQYMDNILLKSITFKLVEKESKLRQRNLNSNNNNNKYYIENNIDQEMEIYHLIIAKENSEAGNYYNEFAYNMIVGGFNSFHFYNNCDIINEIKEEIKTISKNIFVKPIISLNDFENSENKIKLKNNFEFLKNSEENNDFSYLSLKPKYSYYKINNNSQLLVIIEMPGEIINQKFICSKPKDGYYLMKFSGEKKTDLPDNLEEQKKAGLFYSNIDDGKFEEIIRISVSNFQLKSYNYKYEGKNGIYKYYFEIISGTEATDEDEY